MIFGIEYPEPDQTLYANANVASGWCVAEEGAIQSIELHIDGHKCSDAILGGPRLRTEATDQKPGSRSPIQGFRCEFDFGRLTTGWHTFEFRAKTGTSNASRKLEVRKQGDAGPILVTEVYVEIVGRCNLRCAMCPQGNLEGLKGDRQMGFMKPRLFEEILHHLHASSLVGQEVNLYGWGEPLLHPELDQILDACRRYGVRAVLSSNLSLPARHLVPLKSHPVDLLMVTISGFSEKTYRQNHRGGDLGRVLRNLRTLSNHRDTVRSLVLKYLVFQHNQHEMEMARKFAKRYGMAFGAYAGVIPSLESYSLAKLGGTYEREASRHVDFKATPGRSVRSCPQETKIAVDYRGHLEHCTMAWNRVNDRSILDADVTEYLIDKLKNPTCRKCLESGYSDYRHFAAYSSDLLQVSEV